MVQSPSLVYLPSLYLVLGIRILIILKLRTIYFEWFFCLNLTIKNNNYWHSKTVWRMISRIIWIPSNEITSRSVWLLTSMRGLSVKIQNENIFKWNFNFDNSSMFTTNIEWFWKQFHQISQSYQFHHKLSSAKCKVSLQRHKIRKLKTNDGDDFIKWYDHVIKYKHCRILQTLGLCFGRMT